MTLWGPITDAGQAEQKVEDLFRRWFDSGLTELERQQGIELRHLRRPVSYRLDTDPRKLPEDQLPVVVIVSAGFDGEPDYAEDGRIDAVLIMGAFCVVTAEGRKKTQRNARRYAAVMSTLLEKFGGDLAPLAHLATPVSESYDEIDNNADRSLAAGYVTFGLLIPGMRNRYGRPDEPDDPETDPPATSPEDAAHLTTNVTVDEE